MTGKIRTLRVDKGFGFVKGETGQEYYPRKTVCPNSFFSTCPLLFSERSMSFWKS